MSIKFEPEENRLLVHQRNASNMRDQTVQLPAGNRSTKRQFEEMHGRHSSLPKVSQFHPDYARAGKNGTGVYSNAIRDEQDGIGKLQKSVLSEGN